jgi:ribosome-binding factor A
MIQGGMVSISSVKITPDLFEARIYLSFYQIPKPQEALKLIEDRAWEIKRDLVSSIRNQLRSMPQLTYYIDDSLEYVDKMETLFKEINETKPDKGNES